MLYDRKIKYVDYYENGERVKGGGFVKLEVRDGFLKMDLHIKGLYPTDSFVRDVVLKGSETEAVLGRISLQEGVGCFSYSCEMTEGIGSTGISYEDWREIKIPVGGSRELCCSWGRITNKAARDAEPLGTEDLGRESSEPESVESEFSKPESAVEVLLITESEGAGFQGIEGQEAESQEAEGQGTEAQKTEAQKTEIQEGEDRETEIQATVTQKQVVSEPAAQKPAAQEPAAQKPAAQEPAAQEPAAQKPRVQEPAVQEALVQTTELQQAEVLRAGFRGTMSDTLKSENQDSASNDINRHNEKPAPKPQVSEDGGQQKNKNVSEQKPAVKLLEDKWQQLSSIYPHIRPFNDEREYLSLSPSDFVLFPESYYRAANNSFLLHGFYNYKHLILTRVEHRSEVRYYLGVPGNYYEREKQVAVMFGFESFECDREPAKTGDFGYYLMRMEL